MREPFFLPTTFLLVTQREDWPKAHRHHRIYLCCVKITLCSSQSLSGAFSGSSSKAPPDAEANWITMFVKPAFFSLLYFVFIFPQNRFSFRVVSKAALLTLLVPHSHHTGAHYDLFYDCSDKNEATETGWSFFFIFKLYLFLKSPRPPIPSRLMNYF